MIYRKIDVIPWKILLEIIGTNDYKLLVTENEEIPEPELKEIWEKIHEDYLNLNPSPDEQRVFKIHKEIYYNETKYRKVILCCKILAFDYDEESINELIGYGYSITHEDYLDQLERVEREAEGILIQVESFKLNLPPVDESKIISPDEMLASYCTFLGIDFDFNTIPASKVVYYGKQIDMKIKATQKNLADGK